LYRARQEAARRGREKNRRDRWHSRPLVTRALLRESAQHPEHAELLKLMALAVEAETKACSNMQRSPLPPDDLDLLGVQS